MKELLTELRNKVFYLRNTEGLSAKGELILLHKLNALEKQFVISGVVSSAFLVQHKETLINYGLFSTRKKAENYINKNTDLFGIQEVKIA